MDIVAEAGEHSLTHRYGGRDIPETSATFSRWVVKAGWNGNPVGNSHSGSGGRLGYEDPSPAKSPGVCSGTGTICYRLYFTPHTLITLS